LKYAFFIFAIAFITHLFLNYDALVNKTFFTGFNILKSLGYSVVLAIILSLFFIVQETKYNN
jgi:hypothetical protein